MWLTHGRAVPDHPCMNESAHARIARIHLPVAPACNIECLYCAKQEPVSPTTANQPGGCDHVLSPQAALSRAVDFLNTWGKGSIVGIAGPGDPLANESTFETIRLLKHFRPDVRLCLCTNGLNLPVAADRLIAFGFDHVSVTVNGVDPQITRNILSVVQDGDRRLTGAEGAAFLIERQTEGVRIMAAAGVFVKVNSVVIPGINDRHLAETARSMAQNGAGVMNVMPLIPAGRFRRIKPPSMETMQRIYRACGEFLPVFKKCRQCRADACGIPGKEPHRWEKTA